ncbi:MAG: hypothetical protein H0U89_06050, partial [Acidimicrobiia bacterium]|nr:hypothetical protein [Acidimicrobiia bacterium]
GEALERADPGVAALLHRAAVVEAPEDAEDVLAVLALQAGSAALRRLVVKTGRAADPLTYQADVAWLQHRLEELKEPFTRSAAVAQLVPFLRQGGQEAR